MDPSSASRAALSTNLGEWQLDITVSNSRPFTYHHHVMVVIVKEEWSVVSLTPILSFLHALIKRPRPIVLSIILFRCLLPSRTSMLRYHNFYDCYRILEDTQSGNYDFDINCSVFLPEHLECGMVR